MLLVTGQASAADWQFVGSNNTGKYYIDRSSVRWLTSIGSVLITRIVRS